MPSKPPEIGTPEEIKEFKNAIMDDLRGILNTMKGFAEAMDISNIYTLRQSQLLKYVDDAWNLLADLENPEP